MAGEQTPHSRFIQLLAHDIITRNNIVGLVEAWKQKTGPDGDVLEIRFSDLNRKIESDLRSLNKSTDTAIFADSYEKDVVERILSKTCPHANPNQQVLLDQEGKVCGLRFDFIYKTIPNPDCIKEALRVLAVLQREKLTTIGEQAKQVKIFDGLESSKLFEESRNIRLVGPKEVIERMALCVASPRTVSNCTRSPDQQGIKPGSWKELEMHEADIKSALEKLAGDFPQAADSIRAAYNAKGSREDYIKQFRAHYGMPRGEVSPSK